VVAFEAADGGAAPDCAGRTALRTDADEAAGPGAAFVGVAAGLLPAFPGTRGA